MARRIIARLGFTGVGGVAVTRAGNPIRGESCAQIRVRVYGKPGAAGVPPLVRAWVERSTDYDPRLDQGNFSVMTGSQAQEIQSLTDARNAIVDEATRPRGGWIRLVGQLTGDGDAECVAEMWVDTATWESTENITGPNRTARTLQDDRLNLDAAGDPFP